MIEFIFLQLNYILSLTSYVQPCIKSPLTSTLDSLLLCIHIYSLSLVSKQRHSQRSFRSTDTSVCVLSQKGKDKLGRIILSHFLGCQEIHILKIGQLKREQRTMFCLNLIVIPGSANISLKLCLTETYTHTYIY